MGYTGSEMMIKTIVSYSKQINPIILSGEKGALLSEIAENVPVYVYANAFKWKYRFGKLLKKIALPDFSEIQFKSILKKHKIDLVVVNTIVADKIIPLLKKQTVPFVLYSHELPPMYDFIKKEDFNFLISNALGVIGCSKQVCENYKLMGVKNVELFYEGIDISSINTSRKIEEKIKATNFSYYFAMSGQRASHKGFHLILEIAEFLSKYNAALIWLGAPSNYGLNYYIQKVIEEKQIKNVLLPGLLKKEEYYSWLNACDAFLLTSMVDPYPLVMLEATYLQKPIIAFNSGGVSEFIKDGMGRVVPYYCVNDFLDMIKGFFEGSINVDKEFLKKEAEKHDISKKISDFEKILLQYLS
jgi:glycosyltransferase involved in cell wall biosynthesis